LSASLRGLVVEGIAVGVVTYVGLSLVEQVTSQYFEYKMLAAVLAGLMELIPDIGPFLWAIPVGLIGFTYSPQTGVAVIAAYVLGRWLVQKLIVSRFEERVVRGIHPVVLVVAIVALSQFGVLWLFLAAPLLTIARDLFRYVYGRFSEPPRPAGLLPDEPQPVPQTVTSIPARQASRRRQGRSVPAKGETTITAAGQ
jgi:predicted PurR-regulated permease PerM